MAATLAEVASAEPILLCDSETDTDLDTVLAAALTIPGIRLAGAGGLAAALGRALRDPTRGAPRSCTNSTRGLHNSARASSDLAPGKPVHAPDDPHAPGDSAHDIGDPPVGPIDPAIADGRSAHDPYTPELAGVFEATPRCVNEHSHTPVLVVVGTAEASAIEQVRRLISDGANELLLTPKTSDAPANSPTSCATHPITVLRPAQSHTDPQVVVDCLADAAAALATGPSRPHLVLTGGETARRVLDRLGVSELEPLAQIHHGAVRSRTADGRHIVTRPGSFGGPDSLCDIVRALRAGKDLL